MSGRKFTELNAGTVGANSIFAQAQAPATPGDPYTSTKVSATDVGNFVNGTQAYADIGNVTPLAAIVALQQGGASTANANIADEYNPSLTYNTGDRVIYEGVLKVCNDDNVTGAWDSTKWDSATIDEIISALTAADIPYSAGVSVADKLDNVPTFNTLTTSDNNKLLGVSVSGSDISVGAVNPLAYSEGVLTMDNTYIDTTEINNWCRKGNIVEFHLTAKVKSNFTVNNRFAYGLPTPAKTGRMLGISTGNPDKIFRFNLNANGELTHAYSTAVPVANDVIELYGVYICT